MPGVGQGELIGDAFFLCVGDGFGLGGEAELHFLRHITHADPAHEVIDEIGLFRYEFEQPVLHVPFAGLHGGFIGAVDAGFGHGVFASLESLAISILAAMELQLTTVRARKFNAKEVLLPVRQVL